MTAIARAVVLAALHPFIVLAATILILKTTVPMKGVVGILARFGYSFSASDFFGDLMALLDGVFMGSYLHT